MSSFLCFLRQYKSATPDELQITMIESYLMEHSFMMSYVEWGLFSCDDMLRCGWSQTILTNSRDVLYAWTLIYVFVFSCPIQVL